jgi:hypothetical protein
MTWAIRTRRPRVSRKVAREVVCLPACSEADELAALMLAQLLERSGMSLRGAFVKGPDQRDGDQAGHERCLDPVVSTVPPTPWCAASYLCKRLKVRLPEARLTVGVWHEVESELDRRRQRFERVQVDDVFSRF